MSYALHHFKICCPMFAKDMVGYEELTGMDLLVTLADGRKLLFDDFTKTYRLLPRDASDMSDDEYKTEFACRLRSRMQRKCMSQQELSDLTGISQGMLSRYLDGTSVPSFYKVDKIAKALGCSVDDFRYY